MGTNERTGYFSIIELRERVTTRLLRFLPIALWIVFALSLWRARVIGFEPLLPVEAAFVLIITGVYLGRNHLRLEIKAAVILTVLSGLFVAAVAAFGLLSAGIMLAPFISLYLMLLGYKKLANVSIAVSLLYVSLVAFLFLEGRLHLPADPDIYLRSPLVWTITIVAVGVVSITFVTPFSLVPEALQETEERFELAFENANVGMCVTNLEGRFVRVNAAICDILGYTKHELERMNFSDITYHEDLEASLQFVREAPAGGPKMISFEKKYIRKDGGLVWANVSSSLVTDPDRHRQYFITHIQDNTAHKLAEEKLRASEAHYRSLVEHSPDIIAEFDKNGRYLFVNSSIKSVTRLAPEEVLGKSMRDVGFSEERAALREKAIRSVYETKVPFQGEAELTALTGGRRVYNWRIHPVLGPDGSVVSVFSISTDVTEQKEAEEALRKSEEKFFKIFHASPAPMSISSMKDGRYIDVNESFLKYMEYRRDEIIGKSATELGTWADEREREQIVKILRNEDSLRNFEGKYRTKNGRIGISVVSAEMIVLDGERCILGVTLDITERKHAEDALKESMDELHALTARLETIREEERRSISREVHDELGQILTALQMDLMSLKRPGAASPESMGSKIQSMLDLTASATKTVQGISARLRPGMLDDLGLNAAIEWQAEDFQERSGIRCTLDLPDHEVLDDSARSTAIFRILQEALTNVARHSKATGVYIGLSDSGGKVVFSVRDNGIGIPASRVNDPKSYGLLGIRERLRPFGGSCTIQSVPEGGTEVVVRVLKGPQKE
jgi:PAS domain S-box-containing protein